MSGKGGGDTGVFSDLTIVAFSWAMVGPLTLKFFADFGATVIRVETQRRPCVTRTSAPFKDGLPGLNRSGYFNHFSANMLSMSVDMSHPHGIELARELVAHADVVMENFTPGVMDKWGLGYDALRAIKPDIIMARQNGFGVEGPYRNLAAFGMILAAIAGIPNFIGWPDRGPLPAGVSAYTDCISPRFMAAAVIAALEYRDRTGEGQLLDLAQFETAISFFLPGVLDYAVNGREPVRGGNTCEHAAPHNVYPCKGVERWCTVAALDDRQWRTLCAVIGNPECADDPRFDTLLHRKENEAALDALVAQWTRTLDPDEVMERLQAAGVPAGAVQGAADLLADPQLAHRRLFWPLEHGEMGLFTHLGASIDMSLTPPRATMPSPCLGEHNEYVLTRILGKTDDEFIELLASGVLE
ncbi:MAG: CoA transferase [Burkholderiaceae bacterium]|nr:CoA transferase [Burkholderiaceae bacterium]